MLLLELPPELLIVLYESLPDVRTLYNLTQTCTYAQDVYIRDPLSILNHVIDNAYTELSDSVKGTLSALQSDGELDYCYTSKDSVEWIIPEASNPWNPSNTTASNAIDVLQLLADLVNDVEMLANWCTPICERRASWKWDRSTPIRTSVVNTLLRLQLATNRLYNVRLPAFPEHVSIRSYEQERKHRSSLRKCVKQGSPFLEDQIESIVPAHLKHTHVSRKTKEQARDLMKDHLRTIDLPHLRNMWFLMQVLQDQYLLLRRHRLRPRPGSLLDMLFEHNTEEGVWCPSPWYSVQSLLSDLGLHVVPARPSTSFRFLGHEVNHELQEKDIAEFDLFLERLPSMAYFPDSLEYGLHIGACLHRYLEDFRLLIGLPYFDSTSISDLVEAQAPIRSTVGANRYWANASSTTTRHSRLGEALQECGEENRKRKIMQSKNRLRSGRKNSSTS